MKNHIADACKNRSYKKIAKTRSLPKSLKFTKVQSESQSKVEILETSANDKAEKQTPPEIRNLSNKMTFETESKNISGSENSDHEVSTSEIEDDIDSNEETAPEEIKLNKEDEVRAIEFEKIYPHKWKFLIRRIGEIRKKINRNDYEEQRETFEYIIPSELKQMNEGDAAFVRQLIDKHLPVQKEDRIRMVNKESKLVSMKKKGMKRIPKREKM